ncbi:MAG TPA: ATP-binding protein [Chloroflexota bacterium]|nr:ATP-binding protein [Chloroflexota bacterium]
MNTLTTDRPRLLIVGDDPATATLLGDFFRLDGFETIAAPEAEAARLLELQRPAAVVLDLVVPHSPGFTLFHDVTSEQPSSRGASSAVPIVVCAAPGGAAALTSVRTAQVAALLETPVDLEQLRNAVRRAIGYPGAPRPAAVNPEADEARDEFVATAVHDLKNPVAAIRGQVFLLRRHLRALEGDDPAAAMAALTRALGAIDRAATHTLTLLNATLDAVRLRSGESLELETRPTDLVALARAAADTYQEATDRHKLEVRTKEPQLVGMWDGFRLERVLENLLSNAIKYSPRGGAITITIRLDPADGAWAILSVRDHGAGIPAADLQRVMQPFQRGANASAIAPGTGIGLAGARRIVEQHGGTLSVRSVEGVGSIFSVRLPLRTPHALVPLPGKPLPS